MKKFLIILTTSLWVVSIFFLYKKEIKSKSVIQYPYKEFLPLDLILRDEWFGIYFNYNKIGYADFIVRLDNVGAETGYRIEGEAFLILPVLGINERVWLRMNSIVDSEYRLRDFYFSFFTGRLRTEIKGWRIRENKFKILFQEGKNKRESIISIPEGAILGTFFGPPKELKKPKVGKEMRFLTLNPLTMKPQEVSLKVARKEKIKIGLQDYKSFLIEVKFSGLESKAWVDEEGKLLKEETPLGLTIIREPQNKALAFLSTARTNVVDLAEFFSLPLKENLKPEKINKLYILIKGKNLNPSSLNIDRQKVLKVQEFPQGRKVTLLITEEPQEKSSISTQSFLKSDRYIQANEPKIKGIAEYLTRDISEEVSKVKKILKWVYDYLEKKPTLSIPSALTALNLRQGDCNEHTFLFSALARSVGIPTKIKNGLVYIGGKFYYHSWPAVYLNGKWIDVDPTLNQFPADVTHIMLVEGELPQQLDLIKILGKIEVEVVKYE